MIELVKWIGMTLVLMASAIGIERMGVWVRARRQTMSADELQARIRADVTDEDIDRLLPPPLRRRL